MQNKYISKEQKKLNAKIIRKFRAGEQIDAYFLDELNIGTKNYLGVAHFWPHEYRHAMRNLNCVQRIKVHNALMKAGLIVDEATEANATIIDAMYLKFMGQTGGCITCHIPSEINA